MMKKSRIVWSLLTLFTALNLSASLWAKDLNPGPWKFILKTTNADIPFIIRFSYDRNDVLTGKLYNGKETILIKDIKQEKKNITIPLAPYEITLEMTQQDGQNLAGALVNHNKNPIKKTPLFAIHKIKTRYKPATSTPLIDMSGKWSLVMEDEEGVKSPAIGNFVQDGTLLSGSILTPTGDYRYLDGFVERDAFEAASFDGVYNYVFRGVVKNGKMDAAILSNSKTKITGSVDRKAELPDAYKQTQIDHLNFIFPNLQGQNVSLNHPKFKNKPVIVQIFGSWCPNCLDETKFLIPWYKANHRRGIEIVALAFERSFGPEEAKAQLLKTQKRLDIPYVILQAGSTAEDKPAEKITGLKNFISFPTTIFLDKKHKVVKVHAGFSGPSTGEFYETWKKEFNQTVNTLLK